MEAWDVSSNIIYFEAYLNFYNEFLQEDYKNEEGFYKDVIIKFAVKVSNMTKLKRREEDLPSPTKMKQLKACWINKISNLKDIMDNCNEIVNEKENLFRKLIEIDLERNTEEVQDPRLIINSIFMTRKQFEEHVDILKSILAENFNCITEYDESEIENWLVDYASKSQYIEESINNISHVLIDLEGELFYVKIKHEINMAPMKDYIEEWFRKSLLKITEENQEEAVGTEPETVSKEDKRTPTAPK